MTNEEIKNKLIAIRSKLNLFDDIVHCEFINDEYVINENQAVAVQELLDFLKDLNWQLSLNTHKHIEYVHTRAVKESCYTAKAVKIRPCGDEDKHYFGIMLGDIAQSLGCDIDDKTETLKIGFSFYNPAIFVPELKKVVYGCESWWSVIGSEEELKELITDETIGNVWYVKILKELTCKGEE